MQETFTRLIENYQHLAYLIIFLWCILEGELALILAGILAHAGAVHIGLVIVVAALGAFTGDQIYYYIGRYGKKILQKRLYKQRRKFAIAHLLLQKFGFYIIFFQRYMYGFRTVIPMSIGLAGFSHKKFALINLLSAFIWAAALTLLAYIFGEQIWTLVEWASKHWYIALVFAFAFLLFVIIAYKSIEKKFIKHKEIT